MNIHILPLFQGCFEGLMIKLLEIVVCTLLPSIPFFSFSPKLTHTRLLLYRQPYSCWGHMTSTSLNPTVKPQSFISEFIELLMPSSLTECLHTESKKQIFMAGLQPHSFPPSSPLFNASPCCWPVRIGESSRVPSLIIFFIYIHSLALGTTSKVTSPVWTLLLSIPASYIKLPTQIRHLYLDIL